MKAETQILQPVFKMNQINVEPENKNSVRPDLEMAIKERTIILEIKFDVFKPKLSIEDVVKLASNMLSKDDMRKIRESAEKSRKIWFECLTKAEGDIRKARELYKSY